ncbi:glycoside hydrolase family 88 protein [Lederbergia lenta]|uniref:Unsaturated glucuronyl hydrolase n=1 Tax=Lederbergia lenta TaxID=1467 RepID=A0A2X4WQ72_LEDLE|nr:glycoside hydrolase family 88 protein [Lederbergia lenta]MCM3110416.1 glycoside hydrolase family 88 protein [Lederbergia lenta]MEC2324017.1 glycoside hydrolase family 88 protein [Lederbergia lenta]SQI60822.1 unsaturated glucuronyl hydrolase [Lederbergia lenta]
MIKYKIVESDTGEVTIKGIVIGTSNDVNDYYITRKRSENDLHGAGIFIMACMKVEKLTSICVGVNQ